MSTEWNPDTEETENLALSVYQGVPNKPGESGQWKRFLSWFCPWLARKRQLGDEYLEAEVRKRHAEAFQMEADAKLKLTQAEKTAAETAEIATRLAERKFRQTIDVTEIKERTQLQERHMAALEDKINRLRLLYGGKILQIEESDSNQEFPNNRIENDEE